MTDIKGNDFNVKMAYNFMPIADKSDEIIKQITHISDLLLSEKYPKVVARRFNTIFSELLDNALQYTKVKDGQVFAEVGINGKYMEIKVGSPVSKETYQTLKNYIDRLSDAEAFNIVLKQIVKRQKSRLSESTSPQPIGFGLMKLIKDAHCSLKLSYHQGKMVVTAHSSL